MIHSFEALQCPMLLLQLKALLASNSKGSVIEVWVAPNQACADVERFLVKKDYAYQKLTAKDKIRFRIQNSE